MRLNTLSLATALTWLSVVPAPAAAQAYPTRAVTAIPAFPPGAPNDFIMRLVGQQFQTNLKQPLVVENRPGAGATLQPNTSRGLPLTATRCSQPSTRWLPPTPTCTRRPI